MIKSKPALLTLAGFFYSLSLTAFAQSTGPTDPSTTERPPAKPGIEFGINNGAAPEAGAPTDPRAQGNDYGRQGVETQGQLPGGEPEDPGHESIDIDDEDIIVE